jgi:hypothetical protein
MPDWLLRQLRRAFFTKNKRQITILNECWYLYQHTFKSDQAVRAQNKSR